MDIETIKETIALVKALPKELSDAAKAVLHTLDCVICPDSVWFDEE